MPQPVKLARAQLREVRLPDAQRPEAEEINDDRHVTVQFNPESLKLAYRNTMAGDDQPSGAAVQFVSKSSTKLSVTLWLDVTVAVEGNGGGAGDSVNDVRQLTQRVNYFLEPQTEGDNQRPPGVRFAWGSFQFDGVVDSMDETLEYFSADGRPLRAKVELSLSSPSIQFEFAQQAEDGASPGTQPTTAVRPGESIQQSLSRDGERPSAWRRTAAANDVENPRFPGPPGTRLRKVPR